LLVKFGHRRQDAPGHWRELIVDQHDAIVAHRHGDIARRFHHQHVDIVAHPHGFDVAFKAAHLGL
jgi:hypothetical protein